MEEGIVDLGFDLDLSRLERQSKDAEKNVERLERRAVKASQAMQKMVTDLQRTLKMHNDIMRNAGRYSETGSVGKSLSSKAGVEEVVKVSAVVERSSISDVAKLDTSVRELTSAVKDATSSIDSLGESFSPIEQASIPLHQVTSATDELASSSEKSAQATEKSSSAAVAAIPLMVTLTKTAVSSQVGIATLATSMQGLTIAARSVARATFLSSVFGAIQLSAVALYLSIDKLISLWGSLIRLIVSFAAKAALFASSIDYSKLTVANFVASLKAGGTHIVEFGIALASALKNLTFSDIKSSVTSFFYNLPSYFSSTLSAIKGLVGAAGKGLSSAFSSAKKSTADFRDEVVETSKSTKMLETSLEGVGLSIKKMILIGAGVGAAFVGLNAIANSYDKIVETGKNFEYTMSRVRAITLSGIEDQTEQQAQFDLLNKKAREAGSQTMWSATQAGEAMTYMGMAGWDATQIISGLGPVLNLATAGNIELARASDIVTDILSAMKMEAKDAAEVVDVLAKTVTTSNTDIEMLGQTMKYAAPVFATAGYSIQDLAAAAGLLANVGIKESQAGTSLRAMVLRLASPAKLGKEALQELGVVTDSIEFDKLVEGSKLAQQALVNLGIDTADKATGKMLGFGDILKQIASKVGPSLVASFEAITDEEGNIIDKTTGVTISMSEAMSLLGQAAQGNADAIIRLADMGVNVKNASISTKEAMGNIKDIFGMEASSAAFAVIGSATVVSDMYGNKLPTAFETYRQKLIESTGTAEEMAGLMADNLEGDALVLQSATEELMLTVYDQIKGGLRAITQATTVWILGLTSAVGTFFSVMRDIGQELSFVLIPFSVLSLGSVFSPFIDGLKSSLGAIKEVVKFLWFAQKLIVEFFFEGIKDALLPVTEVLSALKTEFVAAFSPIVEAVKPVTDVLFMLLDRLKAAFNVSEEGRDTLITLAGVAHFLGKIVGTVLLFGIKAFAEVLAIVIDVVAVGVVWLVRLGTLMGEMAANFWIATDGLSVFSGFIGKLAEPVAVVISDMLKMAEIFKLSFSAIFSGTPLVGVVQDMVDAASGVTVTFGGIEKTVTPAVSAVGTLSGYLQDAVVYLEGLSEAADQSYESMSFLGKVLYHVGSGVGTAIGFVLTSISHGLLGLVQLLYAAGIAAIYFGKTLRLLLDSFLSFLTKGPSELGKFADEIKGLFRDIWEDLRQIDWESLFYALSLSLGKALSAVFSFKLVKELGSALSVLLVASSAMVVSLFDKLLVVAANGVFNAIASLAHLVASAFAVMVLGSSQEELSESYADFKKSGKDLTHNLLQGMWEVLENAQSFGKAFVLTIVSGVYSGARGLYDAIVSMWSFILDLLPHSPAKAGPLSGDALPGAGRGIVETIAQGIVDTGHFLYDALAGVFGYIKSFDLSGVFSFGGDFFEGVYSDVVIPIIDALQMGSKAVADAFTSFVGSIFSPVKLVSSAIRSVSDYLKGVAYREIDGKASGFFVQAWNDFGDKNARAVVETVLGMFVYILGSLVGSIASIVEGFSGFFYDVWAAVFRAMHGVFLSVVNSFSADSVLSGIASLLWGIVEVTGRLFSDMFSAILSLLEKVILNQDTVFLSLMMAFALNFRSYMSAAFDFIAKAVIGKIQWKNLKVAFKGAFYQLSSFILTAFRLSFAPFISSLDRILQRMPLVGILYRWIKAQFLEFFARGGTIHTMFMKYVINPVAEMYYGRLYYLRWYLQNRLPVIDIAKILLTVLLPVGTSKLSKNVWNVVDRIRRDIHANLKRFYAAINAFPSRQPRVWANFMTSVDDLAVWAARRFPILIESFVKYGPFLISAIESFLELFTAVWPKNAAHLRFLISRTVIQPLQYLIDTMHEALLRVGKASLVETLIRTFDALAAGLVKFSGIAFKALHVGTNLVLSFTQTFFQFITALGEFDSFLRKTFKLGLFPVLALAEALRVLFVTYDGFSGIGGKVSAAFSGVKEAFSDAELAVSAFWMALSGENAIKNIQSILYYVSLVLAIIPTTASFGLALGVISWILPFLAEWGSKLWLLVGGFEGVKKSIDSVGNTISSVFGFLGESLGPLLSGLGTARDFMVLFVEDIATISEVPGPVTLLRNMESFGEALEKGHVFIREIVGYWVNVWEEMSPVVKGVVASVVAAMSVLGIAIVAGFAPLSAAGMAFLVFEGILVKVLLTLYYYKGYNKELLLEVVSSVKQAIDTVLSFISDLSSELSFISDVSSEASSSGFSLYGMFLSVASGVEYLLEVVRNLETFLGLNVRVVETLVAALLILMFPLGRFLTFLLLLVGSLKVVATEMHDASMESRALALTLTEIGGAIIAVVAGVNPLAVALVTVIALFLTLQNHASLIPDLFKSGVDSVIGFVSSIASFFVSVKDRIVSLVTAVRDVVAVIILIPFSIIKAFSISLTTLQSIVDGVLWAILQLLQVVKDVVNLLYLKTDIKAFRAIGVAVEYLVAVMNTFAEVASTWLIPAIETLNGFFDSIMGVSKVVANVVAVLATLLSMFTAFKAAKFVFDEVFFRKSLNKAKNYLDKNPMLVAMGVDERKVASNMRKGGKTASEVLKGAMSGCGDLDNCIPRGFKSGLNRASKSVKSSDIANVLESSISRGTRRGITAGIKAGLPSVGLFASEIQKYSKTASIPKPRGVLSKQAFGSEFYTGSGGRLADAEASLANINRLIGSGKRLGGELGIELNSLTKSLNEYYSRSEIPPRELLIRQKSLTGEVESIKLARKTVEGELRALSVILEKNATREYRSYLPRKGLMFKKTDEGFDLQKKSELVAKAYRTSLEKLEEPPAKLVRSLIAVFSGGSKAVTESVSKTTGSVFGSFSNLFSSITGLVGYPLSYIRDSLRLILREMSIGVEKAIKKLSSVLLWLPKQLGNVLSSASSVLKSWGKNFLSLFPSATAWTKNLFHIPTLKEQLKDVDKQIAEFGRKNAERYQRAGLNIRGSSVYKKLQERRLDLAIKDAGGPGAFIQKQQEDRSRDVTAPMTALLNQPKKEYQKFLSEYRDLAEDISTTGTGKSEQAVEKTRENIENIRSEWTRALSEIPAKIRGEQKKAAKLLLRDIGKRAERRAFEVAETGGVRAFVPGRDNEYTKEFQKLLLRSRDEIATEFFESYKALAKVRGDIENREYKGRLTQIAKRNSGIRSLELDALEENYQETAKASQRRLRERIVAIDAYYDQVSKRTLDRLQKLGKITSEQRDALGKSISLDSRQRVVSKEAKNLRSEILGINVALKEYEGRVRAAAKANNDLGDTKRNLLGVSASRIRDQAELFNDIIKSTRSGSIRAGTYVAGRHELPVATKSTKRGVSVDVDITRFTQVTKGMLEFTEQGKDMLRTLDKEGLKELKSLVMTNFERDQNRLSSAMLRKQEDALKEQRKIAETAFRTLSGVSYSKAPVSKDLPYSVRDIEALVRSAAPPSPPFPPSGGERGSSGVPPVAGGGLLADIPREEGEELSDSFRLLYQRTDNLLDKFYELSNTVSRLVSRMGSLAVNTPALVSSLSLVERAKVSGSSDAVRIAEDLNKVLSTSVSPGSGYIGAISELGEIESLKKSLSTLDKEITKLGKGGYIELAKGMQAALLEYEAGIISRQKEVSSIVRGGGVEEYGVSPISRNFKEAESFAEDYRQGLYRNLNSVEDVDKYWRKVRASIAGIAQITNELDRIGTGPTVELSNAFRELAIKLRRLSGELSDIKARKMAGGRSSMSISDPGITASEKLASPVWELSNEFGRVEVDLRKSARSLRRSLVREIQELLNIYPQMTAGIGRISVGKPTPGFEGSDAYATKSGFGAKTNIVLSQDVFGDADRARSLAARNVATGWKPAGTKDPVSVLTHEFGHAVDYFLTDRFGKAFDSYKKSIPDAPVSRYAATDVGGSRDEYFAELFTAQMSAEKANTSASDSLQGYSSALNKASAGVNTLSRRTTAEFVPAQESLTKALYGTAKGFSAIGRASLFLGGGALGIALSFAMNMLTDMAYGGVYEAIYANMDELKKVGISSLTYIGNIFKETRAIVVDSWNGMWDAFFDFAYESEFGKIGKTIVQELLSKFDGASLKEIPEILSDLVMQGVTQGIPNLFSSIADGALEGVSSLDIGTIPVFGLDIGSLYASANDGFDLATSAAVSAGVRFKDALLGSLPDVSDFGDLEETGSSIVDSIIKGTVGGISSLHSSVYMKFEKSLREWADGFFPEVAHYGSKLVEIFSSGASGSAGTIRDALVSVFTSVTDLLPYPDVKEGPLSDLTASGAAFVEAFIDGLLSVSNKVYNAFISLFSFSTKDVETLIQNIFGRIGSAVASLNLPGEGILLNLLGGFGSSVVDFGVAGFDALFDSVDGYLESLTKYIPLLGNVRVFLNTFRDSLSLYPAYISDAAKALVSLLTGMFALEGAGVLWVRLKEAILSVYVLLSNFVSGISIEAITGWMVRAMSSIKEGVASLLGSSSSLSSFGLVIKDLAANWANLGDVWKKLFSALSKELAISLVAFGMFSGVMSAVVTVAIQAGRAVYEFRREIAALVSAFLELPLPMQMVIGALVTISVVIPLIRLGFASLAASVGPIGMALFAVATGLSLLTTFSTEARNVIASLVSTLRMEWELIGPIGQGLVIVTAAVYGLGVAYGVVSAYIAAYMAAQAAANSVSITAGIVENFRRGIMIAMIPLTLAYAAATSALRVAFLAAVAVSVLWNGWLVLNRSTILSVIGVTWLYNAAVSAWGVAVSIATGIATLYRGVVLGVQAAYIAGTAATWLFVAAFSSVRSAILASTAVTVVWNATLGAFSAITALATGSVWAFTASLLANPVTWVVLGLVALSAALVALVFDFGGIRTAVVDTLNSFFSFASGLTGFGAVLASPFLLLIDVVHSVGQALAGIMQVFSGDITEGFANIVLGVVNAVKAPFVRVKDAFINGLQGIRDLFPFSPPKDPSSPLVGMEESGAALLETFAAGIESAVPSVVGMIKKAFTLLDRFFPHSDAKEGPFSELSVSGSSLIDTFVGGMESSSSSLTNTMARMAAEGRSVFEGILGGTDVSLPQPVAPEQQQSDSAARNRLMLNAVPGVGPLLSSYLGASSAFSSVAESAKVSGSEAGASFAESFSENVGTLQDSTEKVMPKVIERMGELGKKAGEEFGSAMSAGISEQEREAIRMRERLMREVESSSAATKDLVADITKKIDKLKKEAATYGKTDEEIELDKKVKELEEALEAGTADYGFFGRMFKDAQVLAKDEIQKQLKQVKTAREMLNATRKQTEADKKEADLAKESATAGLLEDEKKLYEYALEYGAEKAATFVEQEKINAGINQEAKLREEIKKLSMTEDERMRYEAVKANGEAQGEVLYNLEKQKKVLGEHNQYLKDAKDGLDKLKDEYETLGMSEPQKKLRQAGITLGKGVEAGLVTADESDRRLQEYRDNLTLIEVRRRENDLIKERMDLINKGDSSEKYRIELKDLNLLHDIEIDRLVAMKQQNDVLAKFQELRKDIGDIGLTVLGDERQTKLAEIQTKYGSALGDAGITAEQLLLLQTHNETAQSLVETYRALSNSGLSEYEAKIAEATREHGQEIGSVIAKYQSLAEANKEIVALTKSLETSGLTGAEKRVAEKAAVYGDEDVAKQIVFLERQKEATEKLAEAQKGLDYVQYSKSQQKYLELAEAIGAEEAKQVLTLERLAEARSAGLDAVAGASEALALSEMSSQAEGYYNKIKGIAPEYRARVLILEEENARIREQRELYEGVADTVADYFGKMSVGQIRVKDGFKGLAKDLLGTIQQAEAEKAKKAMLDMLGYGEKDAQAQAMVAAKEYDDRMRDQFNVQVKEVSLEFGKSVGEKVESASKDVARILDESTNKTRSTLENVLNKLDSTLSEFTARFTSHPPTVSQGSGLVGGLFNAVETGDLRIKGGMGGQATAGGRTESGTFDLARSIQGSVPDLVRFTAFNDEYHKGTSSKHASGLALDFTIKDAAASAAAAAIVKKIGQEAGVNLYVKDEYKDPSARSTAGHIHVQFQNKGDAERFSQVINSVAQLDPRDMERFGDAVGDSTAALERQTGVPPTSAAPVPGIEINTSAIDDIGSATYDTLGTVSDATTAGAALVATSASQAASVSAKASVDVRNMAEQALTTGVQLISSLGLISGSSGSPAGQAQAAQSVMAGSLTGGVPVDEILSSGMDWLSGGGLGGFGESIASGLTSVTEGLGNMLFGAAGASSQQAAMLADQIADFGTEGIDMTLDAMGEASSALSSVPWGAIASAGLSLLEGDVGGAVGAAGAAIGQALIPIPVVGGMLGGLIGEQLGGLLGGGETRSGGAYSYNAAEGAQLIQGPSGGEIQGDQIKDAIAGIVEQTNSLFSELGSEIRVTDFTAALETSDSGKGGVWAGGMLTSGAGFGEQFRGQNVFESYTSGTINAEDALVAFNLDLEQAKLQALQAADDLPKWLSTYIGGIDVEQLDMRGVQTVLNNLQLLNTTIKQVEKMGLMTSDEITRVIEAANSFDPSGLDETQSLIYRLWGTFNFSAESLPDVITGVVGVGKAMETLGFNASDLSYELIKTVGGIQPLQEKLKAYYDTFYTEEERRALSFQNAASDLETIFDRISGTGLNVPTSRSEFRQTVSSVDITTESGQEQLSTLLDSQEVMNRWFSAMEQVETSILGVSESTRKADVGLTTLRNTFSAIGVEVPTTRGEFAALLEGTRDQFGEFSTEFMDLVSVVDLFGSYIENANSAVVVMGRSIETWKQSLSEGDLASILENAMKPITVDGQTRAPTREEVEETVADETKSKIYDQMTQSMLSMVSQMVMTGMVQPMLNMATMTGQMELSTAANTSTILTQGGAMTASTMVNGSSISASSVIAGGQGAARSIEEGARSARAILAEAIVDVKERVKSSLEVFKQIMSDEEIQGMIEDLSTGFGEIGGMVYDTYVETPMSSFRNITRAGNDMQQASREAAEAASDTKKTWGEFYKEVSSYRDSFSESQNDLLRLSSKLGVSGTTMSTSDIADIVSKVPVSEWKAAAISGSVSGISSVGESQVGSMGNFIDFGAIKDTMGGSLMGVTATGQVVKPGESASDGSSVIGQTSVELEEDYSQDILSYLSVRKEVEETVTGLGESLRSLLGESETSLDRLTKISPDLSNLFKQFDSTSLAKGVKEFIESSSPEELVLYASDLGVTYTDLVETTQSYIEILKEQEDTITDSIKVFQGLKGGLSEAAIGMNELEEMFSGLDIRDLAFTEFQGVVDYMSDASPKKLMDLAESMGWSTDVFVGKLGDIQSAIIETNKAFAELNSELERRIEGTTQEEQSLVKLDAKYKNIGGISRIASMGQDQAQSFIKSMINDYGTLSMVASEADTTPEDMVSDFTSLLDIMDSIFEEEKKGYEDRLKYAKDFRDYIDDLKLSDLTILNPKQQLEEANRQYNDLLARAKSGDVEAIEQLQGAAQTLLEHGREYYASGSDYTDMYSKVVGDLEGMAIDLESPVSANEAESKDAREIVSAIFGMDTTLLEVGDKLYAAITGTLGGDQQKLYDMVFSLSDQIGLDKNTAFVEMEKAGAGLKEATEYFFASQGGYTPENISTYVESAKASGTTAEDVGAAYGVSGQQVAQFTASQGVDFSGVSDQVILDGLAHLQATLGDDPEQFVRTVHSLATQYGITSERLATLTGLSKDQILSFAAMYGLPAFAKGGVVTRPTVGLVGEAGPEAIVPLNRKGSARVLQQIADIYNIPKFADGGIVYDPTLALIGENGPEQVTPIPDVEKFKRDDSDNTESDQEVKALLRQILSETQKERQKSEEMSSILKESYKRDREDNAVSITATREISNTITESAKKQARLQQNKEDARNGR